MTRNLITLAATAAVLALPATVAARTTLVGPHSQSNSQSVTSTQTAHNNGGPFTQVSVNILTNTQTSGGSSSSTSCTIVKGVKKCTTKP